MGAPISKLPANILAPIKPPFMPPPAFELTQMGSGPSRRFPVGKHAASYHPFTHHQAFFEPIIANSRSASTSSY